MSTILDSIIARKREELAIRKREMTIPEIRDMAAARPAPRGFARSIASASRPAVIAELKKASPSKGLIKPDFDPAVIASAYDSNGAAAISVLTESRYFLGDIEYLTTVSAVTTVPLLRKDFIVDFYQIEEARAYGADAVLLIVAALDGQLIDELSHAAAESGLDTLVEIHSPYELDTALSCRASVVGVNNRNLKTGEVSLTNSIALAPLFPPDTLRISESGISGSDDIRLLTSAGYAGFLIGESLIKTDDPGRALASLIRSSKDGQT